MLSLMIQLPGERGGVCNCFIFREVQFPPLGTSSGGKRWNFDEYNLRSV